MATTTYQAGIEANAVEVSYGKEAVWKTAPASAFQAVRMTGEGLSGQKSRSRPNEIRSDAQASAAITQSESAAGALNFALSYGTYDDLLAGLLNNDWAADLAIVGDTGDISAVASGNKYTSTTSDKFAAVKVGQWIKVSGFTTAANNGFAKVTAMADTATLTVSGPTLADETPTGAAANIDGAMLRNSNAFQSFFIQKKLAAALFLTYPGSFVTGGQLQAQQGQNAQGSLTFTAASETKATSDTSTGTIAAAPTGTVIDTVAGFLALTLDGTAIGAVCKGVALAITKEGSGADYGVGAAAAQGVRLGTFTLAGTVDIFFKDFTLYDKYTAETKVALSYRQVDEDGNAYIITIPAAKLMNPKIVAGGVNQPVMASFTLEGEPDATLLHTLQIDRFDA